MRELTDSEQKILGEARQEYEPEYVGYTIEELAGFDSGFIVALDHTAAQIAALQAERDVLREALKDLLAWANTQCMEGIQDHHSAQAVSIRGRAWVALNRTPTKWPVEAIQEADFVPPPNDEDFMDM